MLFAVKQKELTCLVKGCAHQKKKRRRKQCNEIQQRLYWYFFVLGQEMCGAGAEAPAGCLCCKK